MVACYGFASQDVIMKNLEDHPQLREMFPPTNGVNEEYLKASVEKMFFELDTEDKKDELTTLIQRMKANVEKDGA
jgi:hypothetical protein